MIELKDYIDQYPTLAYFAKNDPSSPTYTRKSKTGKLVVVKKGKRKKAARVAGAIAGGLVGNTIASAGVREQLRRRGYNPDGGFDVYQKFAEQNRGRNLATTAASLAVVGGLGYGGYRLAKKLTDD